MVSFENDYIAGAHPLILKRLMETNMEPLSGYGTDPYCESAKKKIREACVCPEAEVDFLVGGTQTNAAVISSVLRDYEGALAAQTGHVSVHEAGAVEYAGHKVLELPHKEGKIVPSVLREYLALFYADENHEHMVFPGMVYISHPTEYGTLYTRLEMEEIAKICRSYEIPLFLDGARLGYGLTSRRTDLTLKDIARLCDVFYIGGTKVGALCGEAVVFTKQNRPPHFMNSVKKRGALLAKGRLLGIQGGFLSGLSETVIAGSKDGYPELEEKKEFILKVLAQEEEKFNKTIDQGLSILAGMEADMEKAGKKELDGKDAFILYDTYGFPLDLTKEILEEKGYSIDESGFKAAMEEQRKKARSARATTNYMGKDATVYDEIDVSVTTEFVGYDRLSHESKITVLTTEKEITEALSDGDKGTVLVEQTPFYATMGGQEGDTGVIRTTEGEFRVESTIKLMGGKVGHVGYMTKGMLKAGDTAVLEVNAAGRNATCKNHSATHLLQKALKTVLGSHVEQKGSLVTPNRLRFDFAHFAPMTQEEIAKAEELVNREIQASLPVVTEIMNVEDAKKSGAMALFGEKYEDEVRVVSMGDFSRELCGGTHVANTGTITVFKIVSESGIAAGVRRIEALTGDGVFVYYKEAEQKLAQAAALLKTTPNELADKISHLQAELKAAQSENESLKSKLAQDALGDVMNQVQEVKGVKLLAASLEDVDMNGLRDLGDQLKEKLGEGVVVLASAKGGKVSLLAMATDAAQKAGAHAGNLIKGMAAIVGGGGGGRPNMAQAGGKNPEKIGEALEAAAEILMGQIK